MRGRRNKTLALAGALTTALACALAGPTMAEPASPGDQVMRVDLQGGSARQRLSLPKGKSAIIELPVDARDVLVTNPAVADVVLRTPRRLYVMGVAAGQTDAAFFDAAGRQIMSVDIRVDTDISALEDTLRRVAPGSNIRVEPAAHGIVLTGVVANASESARAEKVALQFVGKPELVVNALSIAGKDQVMLKVRIVEMQRSAIKQLGFDLNVMLNRFGDGLGGMFQLAPTFAVNGELQGGGQFQVRGTGGDADDFAGGMIQAFERVGLVRTLAEPNLTAISGEAANFLAGGEFPLPVAEDNEGRISLEYKPFGVSLGFTPIVLSEGRISLRLSTEVSELSPLNSFSTGNLVIPALNVRRAETTVEMPSGGSLMIAGLLQERTRQNIDKFPGLGNLPVLGALFRSRDFLNDETELVIIVTPYLVEPTSPGRMQTPADGFRLANDAQTVFLGKLNDVYRASPGAPTAYQAPVGPVID
jgi:pilus assembly protein CpaC